MVFSSPAFLFIFLPMACLTIAVTPAGYRNLALLIVSLAFYYYGGGLATAILVASILLNYKSAQLMRQRPASKNGVLAVTIALNLLPLIIFKYLDFLSHAANDVFDTFGVGPLLGSYDAVLPPGISFFTFQAISYVCDVHSGHIARLPRLVDFGMYHASFPQLVAGPIVRYREVEGQIAHRPIDLDAVHRGIVRFCFGLAKKIIIADNLGTIADRVFDLHAADLTTSLAWLGAVTYMLQIFFDFSGYSDMAIGLACMLGFKFPENFNQPYRSRSVTEFWRRWHMTLSRWFRDYVYIPLGGNRGGPVRTMLNLYAVFFLCGLWHGASYTFVVWGLYHGTLLAAERLLQRRFAVAPNGLAGWLYTSLAVVVGWVIFRSPTLSSATTYIKALAGVTTDSSRYSLSFFLTADKLTYLVAGIVIALAPPLVFSKVAGIRKVVTESVLATLCFGYTATEIAANGFNPFIYFRF